MNAIEKQLGLENDNEVMKLPEVVVKEESGPMFLSILLRGYNPSFGGNDHELSGEINEYFIQYQLNEDSIKFLSEIKALEEDGVDEEVLFNMALTYKNEDRIEDLFKFISKYKKSVKNPEEIRKKLLEIIRDMDEGLPEILKQKFKSNISADIKKREQNLDDSKQKIQSLIDFFNPKSDTTSIEKVVLLPTDFLMSKKSGTAFNFDKELYIISHVDNPHNLEHEFLHSVINPIVDKLEKQLSDEEKQKISSLASYQLKVEQKCGYEYYSLLCEELIRTYNDVFQHGGQLLSYEDFVKKIDDISEEKFYFLIKKKDSSFKKNCAKLQIATLEDLKNKSQEYFINFEKNDLRKIIFSLYQDFVKEKENNNNLSFEEYVLKEFSNKLRSF